MRLLFMTMLGIAAGNWLADAEEARIVVHANEVQHAISHFLTGACIEDVNHEIYGGIYSQMIFGEAFQEPEAAGAAGISGMWRAATEGTAQGRYALDKPNPFLGVQAQRVTFSEGEGSAGVTNQGLNRWGMNFVAGKPYEGSVWARSDATTELWATLESGDGKTLYAETKATVQSPEWRRYDFELTPNASDTSGRFALKLKQTGSVVLGYAFLQPGEWGRFKNLPVRRDVAEGLQAQGLTVLRYGGSMVNAPEYRWKKMIGPRDRRPPYKGFWYPCSTNGWSIPDFVQFCEALGVLGVPAFNMGETPQDMADFVEYTNGPAKSAWGKKRAEDGHSEPYRLRYLELGNEEKVDDAYFEQFKPMAEAIWAKDADIVIVVGDFMYSRKIDDPFHFDGSPVIHSLAAHRKILALAKGHNRPVYFDVHIGNNEPKEPNLTGTLSYIEAMEKINPGADFKVCIFEENAGNHAIRRALGHAHAINAVERIGDRVPILCAANCLQPYRQNDNDWDQGMLFLTPSQVWGQPPYYVTQMISRNYLPNCVRAEATSPHDALDVTAKADTKLTALTLQVVNTEKQPIDAVIQLNGFQPKKDTAHVSVLSGELDGVNTPEAPERIVPQESEWKHRCSAEGTFEYTFPAYSFTLIRLEK